MESSRVPAGNPGGFPKFPLLPRELRNRIWQFAAPDILPFPIPQTLATTHLRIPGCFQVNKEAREEIARCTPFYLAIHNTRVNDWLTQQAMLYNPCIQKLCKVIRELVVCQCVMICFEKDRYHNEFPNLQKVFGLSKLPPTTKLGASYYSSVTIRTSQTPANHHDDIAK
ncbi:hypothetical protein F4805DRAFT_440925 [Annulohypoxylon moriforme]|nr:hypothetical protein F4805DRAFT_440925 [Annulohypoxylon moriforme]